MTASGQKESDDSENLKLTTGSVVIYVRPGQPAKLQVGLVLSVFRRAKKHYRLSHLPVLLNLVAKARVAEMTPMKEKEGWFTASETSFASVVPPEHMVTLLQLKEERPALDCLQVELSEDSWHQAKTLLDDEKFVANVLKKDKTIKKVEKADAVNAKAEKPKEEVFVSTDFKPTRAGNANIKKFMQHLLHLDRTRFPAQPVVDENGQVVVYSAQGVKKKVGLNWASLLSLVPEYFENKYKGAKKEVASKKVHSDLSQITEQLQQSVPVRSVPWFRKLIYFSSLGRKHFART